MTRVQYASDLHLDHFPSNTPFATFLKPVAPTLVLAGDIASVWSPVYNKFIIWCSLNWKHVILITGNHEYFCYPGQSHSRKDTERHIQIMFRFLPNVHFLQNGKTYTLPDTKLVFIGTTLYSDIDPSIHDEILSKGDFTRTYTETINENGQLQLTHPRDHTAAHTRHRQLLADAIRAVPRNYKAVVVTHYLPTLRLLEPEYQEDRWRSCYASKDEDLMRPPVKVWICGHGHRATHVWGPHNILVAMNARGYKRYEVDRKVDIYQPTRGFII